ncbi:MAG: hypothetical protein LBI13_06720 [Streptococcaceae bacterium]|jgi:hypothetical protein|nr:hypothetical protein [Streptococcaceae bacterium]
MTNKVKNFINNVSFEQAKEKISFQDVYEDMHGKEGMIGNFALRTFVTLLFSVAISVFVLVWFYFEGDYYNLKPSVVNIGISWIAVVMPFCFFLFYRIRYGKYSQLNKFKNNIVIFLSIQTTFIYIAFLVLKNIVTTPFIDWYFLGLLIISVYLVYKIWSYQVILSLNKNYDLHLTYSSWIEWLNKYLIAVATLTILSMWFYAHFKWGLTPGSSDGLSLLTGVIGYIVKIVGTISLSLLPVLLVFNSDVYVRGKLLEKYSSQFFDEFDFTKEEWGTIEVE